MAARGKANSFYHANCSNLGAVVNVSKTEGPASALVILGLHYCALSAVCSLDPANVAKYAVRLNALLAAGRATSKELERVVGNLQFAAWVEPFGRPLLSFIALGIVPDEPDKVVRFTRLARMAMRVWLLLLHRYRDLSFEYILDELPLERRRIYVDAAPTGGIRGYAYFTYFSVSLRRPFIIRQCSGWTAFPRTDIAWLELFAAFVAIDFFNTQSPGHYIILYSDNTNVVAWLTRRRSPNPYVYTLVSAL